MFKNEKSRRCVRFLFFFLQFSDIREKGKINFFSVISTCLTASFFLSFLLFWEELIRPRSSADHKSRNIGDRESGFWRFWKPESKHDSALMQGVVRGKNEGNIGLDQVL